MKLLEKDILRLIEEHKVEVQGVKKYRDAIDNKYEIRNKKNTKGGANNKVPVNFAKKIKNNVHGYMFGEPLQITHKDNPELQQFFSEMFTYNNKNKLLSNLGEELLDVGRVYWLLYVDDNKYLKILQVPIEEMILIRNERDSDIIDIAIRYYYREGVDIERLELVVEVYTDKEVYYYVEDTKQGLVADYGIGEPIQHHVFGHVPVIEFLNNDGESEYKDVLDLINLYIKLLNLGVDETEEIRNSYLTVLGAFLDDETIDRALKSRVFQVLTDGDSPIDIKFINKDVDTTSFESFLDRVRRLIFEIAGIPDMNSLEQKTQDLSGRAMIQLRTEMEHRSIGKETNIEYSLIYFLRVIRRYVKLRNGLDYNLSDFEIRFRRNLPKITQVSVENIDDFIKLKESGLLDKKTLLGLLECVKDPQNALEMKKKEDNEAYGINYDFEGHEGE